MDDEELSELRAELEQLREFKRVVMENFAILSHPCVVTVPAGHVITDTKQLMHGTVIEYEAIYDKHK